MSNWLVRVDHVVAALVCWSAVGLPQFSNQQELTHPLSPAKLNQKRLSLHRVVFHSPIVRICFLCAPRLASERQSIPINSVRLWTSQLQIWNARDACYFQVAENGIRSETMDEPQCFQSVADSRHYRPLTPCQLALVFSHISSCSVATRPP